MNLRALANSLTQMINPNVPITWERSTGYTQDQSTGVRSNTVSASKLIGQVQPLTTGDMQLLDGMNLQGVHQAVYLNAQSSAVIRGQLKGDDAFIIRGQIWRVIATPEAWYGCGWSKVFVTLRQTSGNSTDGQRY